jgi:lysine biosynthesis protein LysW
MARCPECNSKLTLPEKIERWDHVYCESCNAELEVLSLRPLELEAVYDFEEDDLLDDLDDEDDLDQLEWDDDDYPENDEEDEDGDW